jgi:hypothetical protein
MGVADEDVVLKTRDVSHAGFPRSKRRSLICRELRKILRTERQNCKDFLKCGQRGPVATPTGIVKGKTIGSKTIAFLCELCFLRV